MACSSNADSRPSSAEATWSAASCSRAARCRAVYPPPPNDSSSPAATSGAARSVSAGATTSDEPGRILQDLGHALPRPLHGDAARRDVGAAGDTVAFLRPSGVELGGGQAGPDRLHVGDEIDQVLDRWLLLPEAHRVGARERETQRELGFRQPAVELMPEEPGGDRLGRGLREEDALPRDEHVVEPHLAVELVEPAAERRQEWVRVARGQLAAEDGDAGRIHGHDEGRAMTAVIHPRVAADVDVLGIRGTGVHGHFAAQHEAGSVSRTIRSATRSRGSSRRR